MRKADNPTTFMCRLSSNMGASASWNPQGLPGTVMGLLYPSYIPHKNNLLVHICKGKNVKFTLEQARRSKGAVEV